MPRQSTYDEFTPVLSDYVSATDDPAGTPVHGNVTLTSLRDLLQANLTKATIAAAANAEAIVSTGYSLTGSNAQSLIDLAGTWNTTGTPTLLKVNVTDTASNTASKLLDLQVGGSSKMYLTKAGVINVPNTNANMSTGYAIAGVTILGQIASSTVIRSIDNGGGIAFAATGATSSTFWGKINQTQLTLGSEVVLQWANHPTSLITPDLAIAREAANTLALRNSTAQQTMNIYGTYTDANNYRRVAITMTTAGVASIAPAGAGTGASGNVLHISGLPTSNPGAGILWNNGGTVEVGT